MGVFSFLCKMDDKYLGSIKSKTVELSSSKEIALSDLDGFVPRAICVFKDIVAISCSKGDYNLVIMSLSN